MNISAVIKILKKQQFKGAVELSDPFKVLISTIISQRTKDEITKKTSKRIFSKYKDVKSLAKANAKSIKSLIKPCGFYKQKAKNIKKVAQILVEKYNNKVPDNLKNLINLPGVGRKTANCVLIYGYKKKAIPVDTHVHRISNRLGWVKTKNPEETELKLMKIVPRKYWLDLNSLFVNFGKNVCMPRKPRCFECPIWKHCKYKDKLKVVSRLEGKRKLKIIEKYV